MYWRAKGARREQQGGAGCLLGRVLSVPVGVNTLDMEDRSSSSESLRGLARMHFLGHGHGKRILVARQSSPTNTFLHGHAIQDSSCGFKGVCDFTLVIYKIAQATKIVGEVIPLGNHLDAQRAQRSKSYPHFNLKCHHDPSARMNQ
jgi:hypothetical protein